MDYHLLSSKEAIEKLDSDEQGLTKEQAQKKLKEFGENKLKKTNQFNAIKVFFEQFKSFLIIVLIAAAILSMIMQSKIDAIVILTIVFLNAGMGFFQEYKAGKAIEELNKMMVPETKVLRDGRVIKINSEKIVPGDILILDEGDKIMADARIIESQGLKINEAPLTGESVSQEKISRKLDNDIPLADRINMIYQGTKVMSGNGRAVVVYTGMNTEIGKISELVQEIEPEKNPFKDKLDSFAKKIGIVVSILTVIIVLLLIFTGSQILQSFLVATSLAVAAIPEGLPAVVSLGLAFATRRMIKKNILIRRLPASETLGRTTVICTDKTGTLTQEKMQVTSIYSNGKINPAKETKLLFKTGILCNKARIEKNENKEYFIGDPTEIALIVSAKNNFLNKKQLTEQEPRVKEFTFTSERKMMSIVRDSKTKLISYVKGAPEKIIEKCNYELINNQKIKLEQKDKQRLTKVYEEMAEQGLRVLGFAYKDIPKYLEKEKINQKIAEENLTFIGFQGMIDPPRPEVENAIKICKQAGIKVIMLTGDSKLTATAVAKQIGLTGKSIESKELENMSDKELFNEIDNISIFSRISPQDKLRIINMLKQKNEIVAMTGDGVNDALALKRSDIGISMGIRGTDVARDSSDIILVDDNFASIVQGIKEGRRVYNNTKKFVKYILSANFLEVFLVITIMLIFRNPELLPLLPLHILWINLATETIPALALTSEPIDEDVMKKKPSQESILKGISGFIITSGITGLILIATIFILNMDNIDKARTMTVTTAVMYHILLVFNCKSDKSVFKSPINKYLFYAVFASMALHLTILYSPLNKFFHFAFLGINEWGMIVGFAFIGFFIMEGYKFLKGKQDLLSK